jgi:protein phosphatase 1 regulatory subunit 11
VLHICDRDVTRLIICHQLTHLNFYLAMSFIAVAGISTSAPSDSSRTMIIEDIQPRPEEGSPHDTSRASSPAQGLLRLRGAPNSRPRVVWREDVIDNENMGRKSSKSIVAFF